MAKKLENLLMSYRMALVDSAEYPCDAAKQTALRNVENNIKGAFGDAHKLIASLSAQLNAADAKVRELTPKQPTIEYEAFDAAKVKSGDTVEVRDVSKFGQFAPWRETTFVCIAPRTGLVITETDMQALAHQTPNVRIAKRTRQLQMFAHVYDLNGSVAGTISNVVMPPPAVPEGARHVGNNVPVTITVAE